MLGLLIAACAARPASGQHHEHAHTGGANPLACSPASGEACYYAVIDDFHAINSPHPDAIGEAFFALNAQRTELRYRLDIDGLSLKASVADRTAPEDVIGIHLHLNVRDTVGPHVFNFLCQSRRRFGRSSLGDSVWSEQCGGGKLANRSNSPRHLP
jgi:hypothetical protein